MISIDLCNVGAELNPCGLSGHRHNAMIIQAMLDFLCNELYNDTDNPAVIQSNYIVDGNYNILWVDCSLGPIDITVDPTLLKNNHLIVKVIGGNPLTNQVRIINTLGDIYDNGNLGSSISFMGTWQVIKLYHQSGTNNLQTI